jgi:hypothetical protein
MEVICLMEKIKCLRKPTRHGNALWTMCICSSHRYLYKKYKKKLRMKILRIYIDTLSAHAKFYGQSAFLLSLCKKNINKCFMKSLFNTKFYVFSYATKIVVFHETILRAYKVKMYVL